MKPHWEDLDARARGLAGRLLGRERLLRIFDLGDLREIASELQRAGYGPSGAPGESSPSALERAVRRGAAARFAILARWAAGRAQKLAVVFEDEDRRSLRAVARGAAAGAPSDASLRGLVPTPTLPPRALEELARQPSLARLFALLAAWGHPYARALAADASLAHPDLFRVETKLNRLFARRAGDAAKGAGRVLEDYVSSTIDLENVQAAVAIAGHRQEIPVADCHLAGGRRVTPGVFGDAAVSADARRAMTILSAAFAGTPYAALLGRRPPAPAELEAALLRARIQEASSRARIDPLGPSPFLAFVLRLRAEVADLQRIVWGLALGTPRAAVAHGLVTAS